MEEKLEHDGLLVHALHRAYQKEVYARMAEAGLEDVGAPPMLLLIRRWNREGRAASQRDLAEALHISPATVATSLRSLERGGYVEKRMDPGDQRRRRVSITVRGEEAVDRCTAIFREVDRQMFGGFTPEERQVLARWHWKMLANLRSVSPEEMESWVEKRGERPCSEN